MSHHDLRIAYYLQDFKKNYPAEYIKLYDTKRISTLSSQELLDLFIVATDVDKEYLLNLKDEN